MKSIREVIANWRTWPNDPRVIFGWQITEADRILKVIEQGGYRIITAEQAEKAALLFNYPKPCIIISQDEYDDLQAIKNCWEDGDGEWPGS